MAVRAEQLADFYVPDEQVLRRAVTLLGEVRLATQAAAEVRVAPVPAVVEQRVDLPQVPSGWPLAHPLFVALDLAADVGRGREVLEAWPLGEGWKRVW